MARYWTQPWNPVMLALSTSMCYTTAAEVKAV